MKNLTRILSAAALVLFGTSAWPFSDGFEAHAQAQIKAISIDAAAPIPVQNVKIDAAGLLTAIKVGPPIPPPATDPAAIKKPPVCTEPGWVETGKVQPAGFTGNVVQWDAIFYGAKFPETPSFAAPVGAFTLKTLPGQSTNKGPEMVKRYITVPFVPGPRTNYKLSFMGVQAVWAAQYYNPRAAEMVFVSISPCAGDLRKKATSPDPWIGRCRTQGSNPNMFYNTTGAAAGCPLEAGKLYFLNLAFVDTTQDPLSLTATTCAVAGNRCEVNVDN